MDKEHERIIDQKENTTGSQLYKVTLKFMQN